MDIKEPEIQTALWEYFPIYKHIGLTVESARNGIFRCRVPLTAANGNHLDTVHAALQFAVAEVLGGVVILSTFGLAGSLKVFGAVKSASIEFLRPARTAITAEAMLDPGELEGIRTRIASGREARFPLEATVKSTTGEIVATMSAEYIVRPRRAASQSGV